MSEFTSEFKGTCPVDRRIFETEWFCKLSPTTSYLALYLLITANYTDKNSKTMQKKILRGQWGGSIGTKDKPGRMMNETGLAFSTIRDSLEKLIAVGFITKNADCHGTIITIPQYDVWTKSNSSSTSRADRSADGKTDSNKEIETEVEEFKEYIWDDDE